MYIPPKTMPEVPMAYSSRQQTLRDSPKKGFELSRPEPTEAPRAPAPPPSEPRPGLTRTEPIESTPDQKADTKKVLVRLFQPKLSRIPLKVKNCKKHKYSF